MDKTKDLFSLRDKNILLIGFMGVLGRAYKDYLIGKCNTLILADINIFHDVNNEIGHDTDTDTDILYLKVDVSDEKSVQRLFIEVEKRMPVHAVISNAAITGEFLKEKNFQNPFPSFEDYPLDLFKYTLDVNLVGCFLISRSCSKMFKKQGFGSLINVASIFAVVAPDHEIYNDEVFNTFPGYPASKWGVLGLTKWIATLWGKDNLRANCISPGGIENNHSDSFKSKYAKKTPMQRMGRPDDLFGVVHYLISDASSYVTGQNFIVDGGYTVW